MARKKQFTPVNTETFLIGSVFVTHEFDAAGGHRIGVNDHYSAPRGYLGIVKLVKNEGTFCGTTEYYGDTLPRVFQVIEGHHVAALEEG